MKTSSLAQLRWHKVAAPIPRRGLRLVGAKLHPLAALARAVGVPMSDGQTPKQHAVLLLRAASEIEHEFVVQYLFSLFSINEAAGGDPSWSSSLKNIAVQEMGHLITVQNLLLFLGNEPYLERDRQSIPKNLLPFPTQLEPFSLDAIKKYVVAESPLKPTHLPPELKDLKRSVNHVGLIYATLYWLFQKGDQPEGPWKLPAAVIAQFKQAGLGHLSDTDFTPIAHLAARLATPGEWHGGSDGAIVLPDTAPAGVAGIRAAAKDAIFRVDAQGEGGNDMPDSHFKQFLGIYNGLKSFPGNPALNVAINPTTGQPAASGTNPITEPATLLWARLFNVRYQMLMLEIAHALSLPAKPNAPRDPRREMVKLAFNREMHVGIAMLASGLVKMPRVAHSASAQGQFAGPPFELSGEVLPATSSARWQRHLDLMDQSTALTQQIGLNHDLASKPLLRLKQMDDVWRPFVKQQLP